MGILPVLSIYYEAVAFMAAFHVYYAAGPPSLILLLILLSEWLVIDFVANPPRSQFYRIYVRVSRLASAFSSASPGSSGTLWNLSTRLVFYSISTCVPQPRRDTNGTSSQSPCPSANSLHATSSIGGAKDDVHAHEPDDTYGDDGDRDYVDDFMPDDLSSDVGVDGDADASSDVNDNDENDAWRERHDPNPLYIKRARGQRIDETQQGTLFDLPVFTPPTALYLDPLVPTVLLSTMCNSRFAP